MAKSKVSIQPLADRVVVKAAEAETKTKSGILGVVEFMDIKKGRAQGMLIPINYFIELKRK